MWRAVSADEAADIKEFGFRPNPTGEGYQLVRLFFEKFDDMEKFAPRYNLSYGVQAQIPEEVVPKLSNPEMNGDEGPALGVSAEDLPDIFPTNIFELPL